MIGSPEDIEDTDHLAVVCAALAAEADPDLDGIDPDWQLTTIPGLESVKALRAVVRIEDACGIAIPDDFLFETNTVRQLADLVARLVEKTEKTEKAEKSEKSR